MKQAVYIHRYSLHSRYLLNSQSERLSFDGALVRVGDGFGCIHPWTELGDQPLVQLLHSLSNGDTSSAIVRNALACAKLDGDARLNGINLFDNCNVPYSHATLVKPEEQFQQAYDSGFRVMKIKAGRNVKEEAEWLNAHSRGGVRWRLDFNQSLSRQQLNGFLELLSSETLAAIDFLEDPCMPFENLNGLGLPLAVDRGVEECAAPYSFAVIKPAVDAVDVVLERACAQGMKSIFTSYMDHPLGQSYAAYVAAQYSIDIESRCCGLMTHGLFEDDAFTEALGEVTPSWQGAKGTGLGFDSLLDNLAWERIC